MKLVMIPMSMKPAKVRAAPAKRDWMDATPDGFAYRCLPLTIANSHGWEILNTAAFTAVWNGGVGKDDIAITFDGVEPAMGGVRPMSHFGSGVLTFELAVLFRTEPGWNMITQGPVNRPKDAISGLSGVIETDWSPYSFTMNWLFTRAQHPVRFEVDEPIAHVYPVQRGALEAITPEIRLIDDEEGLRKQTEMFSNSRKAFNAAQARGEAWAVEEKWQKSYYRGERPSGKPGAPDHAIKLRLKPFKPAGDAARMWEGEGETVKPLKGS